MSRYRTRTRTAVAIIALSLVLAACDWTTYRGGPEHTGSVGESVIDIDNVATLRPAWSTGHVDNLPVVVGGRVYTVGDWTLEVYDAAGVEGCSGTPKVCEPIWTADAYNGSPQPGPTIPTVAGGMVYVSQPGAPMLVFDAAGETNCGGVPKKCEPLWSAVTDSRLTPTVAGGIVYLASTSFSGSRLLAYDAAGNTRCSGSPKVCQPIWSAPLGTLVLASLPSVGGGRVFIATNDGKIRAFDAAGVEGCSGIPKTCAPLATLETGATSGGITVPAVSGGRVYVVGPSSLYAFDADGNEGCGGVPLTCSPLWRAAAPGGGRPLAVSGGLVYLVKNTDDGPLIAALSADGTTGCSGVPRVCVPLWRTLPLGTESTVLAPAVANGVLYATASERFNCCQSAWHVLAYDATGSLECSGSPKGCAPVFDWTVIHDDGFLEPVVADGTLYVFGGPVEPTQPPLPGRVTAFKLP